MSSANRERRRQNRETKMVAAEEGLRRSRRQRIILVSVGLVLAVVVGAALVSRATGDDDAASSSTTSSTRATSSTASTTSTTIGNAAGKPCVAMAAPLPAGTPTVPVQVGPPPQKLVKEDLKVGTGAAVKPHATVTVHYVGVACSTGKIISASYGGEPLTQALDGFVAGWRNGIPGMRVGGQRLLGLPPALAYGAKSPGPGIAPNESLWFVIEIVDAK